MIKKIEPVNSTAIAEYSETEKGLALLRDKLKDAKYEVTTTAGLELAKKDRRECVTLRTTLEEKRKEIKAPALKRCKDIDEEAKRIMAEIVLLEDPIDAQIKAEESRKEAIRKEKEEAERLRVEKIKERITVIAGLHLKLAAVPNSLAMRDILQTVREQVTATKEEFAEWLPMAESTLADTLAKMEIIVAEKEAAEIEEIRKAEEYKQQQFELKVQGMIQEIRGWAYSCFGHDSAQLVEDHRKYAAVKFTHVECGEFLQAVESEAVAALLDIESMIDAAKKREESDRQVKEQQEKLDRDKEAFDLQQRQAKEKQDKEDTIRAKIQDLRDYYVTPSMTSSEIEGMLALVGAVNVTPEEYGDLFEQAVFQQGSTVKALTDLFNERVETERLAEEKRLQDEEDQRVKEEKERTDREVEEKRKQEEFEEKMKAPYDAIKMIRKVADDKELSGVARLNQIIAICDIALSGKE